MEIVSLAPDSSPAEAVGAACRLVHALCSDESCGGELIAPGPEEIQRQVVLWHCACSKRLTFSQNASADALACGVGRGDLSSQRTPRDRQGLLGGFARPMGRPRGRPAAPDTFVAVCPQLSCTERNVCHDGCFCRGDTTCCSGAGVSKRKRACVGPAAYSSVLA